MLAVLEADRARLSEIRNQILDLQRSIAGRLTALRDEQVAAQQRLDSYKYPIMTLPNEITSEIFVQFLPPDPELPQVDCRLSPIRLTHVCRKWRAVAIATLALWKGLQITLFGKGRESKGLTNLVDMWLQRSGCCPLSIQLYAAPENSGDNLLPTLLSYRARFQHLKLALVPPRSLPQMDSQMPLLRSLKLTLLSKSQINHTVLWDAPELREVTLSFAPTLKVVLPWAQLTSLSLCTIEPRLCLSVLCKTPNLVSCTLDFGIQQHAEYTSSDTINLPALTSLIIRMYRPVATGILTDLVVPALQQLEVPESFLGGKPIDLLTSFISKSGCTPRKLLITSRKRRRHVPNITDEQYRAACPSVVDFSSTVDPADSDDSGAEDSDREELSDSENDSGDSGSGSE